MDDSDKTKEVLIQELQALRKRVAKLEGELGYDKQEEEELEPVDLKEVEIFTDGACSGNPGPGGYGVILRSGERRLELAAGFRRTTNNRMELLAVIKGLEVLKNRARVTVYSDSKYIVDAVNQGWAIKWRSKGWRRNAKEKAKNPDLWAQLLDLNEKHQVKYQWVKGHSGHPENEHCDQLAVAASQGSSLKEDEGYSPE